MHRSLRLAVSLVAALSALGCGGEAAEPAPEPTLAGGEAPTAASDPFAACNERQRPPSWLTCVVAAALREELPEEEIVEVSELAIRVGADRVLYLDHLFTQVGRSQSEDEAIAHIATFLRGALENLEPPPVRAEHVRATLKPEGWARELSARLGGDPLLARPFGGGVEVVYVLDLGSSMRPLRRPDLAALGLSEDELHALSLRNLGDALQMPELQILRGRSQVTVLEVRDGYDAARLLVPALFTELARQTDGHLVVAAPARDLVMMVDGRDASDVLALRALAATAFEAGPYAISATLFRYTPEGFVPLEPP